MLEIILNFPSNASSDLHPSVLQENGNTQRRIKIMRMLLLRVSKRKILEVLTLKKSPEKGLYTKPMFIGKNKKMTKTFEENFIAR